MEGQGEGGGGGGGGGITLKPHTYIHTYQMDMNQSFEHIPYKEVVHAEVT